MMTMVLCKGCIETAKKQGENLIANDEIIADIDDCIAEKQPCECCGKYRDLYFCWIDPNAGRRPRA